MTHGEAHHLRGLVSCALTCMLWLSRSRFNLFRTVYIRDFQDLNTLRFAFNSTPSLRNLVHAVHVDGGWLVLETAILVLAPILPNIRCWRTGSTRFLPSCQFRAATYSSLRLYSQIQHLVLKKAHFPNISNFSRLLLALPSLRHLHCANIGVGPKRIKNHVGRNAWMDWLILHLRLATLEVSCLVLLVSLTLFVRWHG